MPSKLAILGRYLKPGTTNLFSRNIFQVSNESDDLSMQSADYKWLKESITWCPWFFHHVLTLKNASFLLDLSSLLKSWKHLQLSTLLLKSENNNYLLTLSPTPYSHSKLCFFITVADNEYAFFSQNVFSSQSAIRHNARNVLY